MIRGLNGKSPVIAESAFISEAAYIIGDVVIGEYSSVWPGAVIRGDIGRITIGRNTAVEDNVVLHAGSLNTSEQDLTIGDYVQIGHAAAINCKQIGNNVLVGMNATLLHDAEIGDYCIIAAGCVVSEAMKIPDKSFVVGVPAKIKREVTKEQLRWVEQAPKEYLKLVNIYKKASE